MKKTGFTLTEMLIGLLVFAIILSIGAPSFNNFLSTSNMISNSNGMASIFNYARMEAMKRGSSVQVSQVTANSWSDGVVVSADGNELRLLESFDNDVSTISTNSLTSFTFSASGEVDNSDILTICDDRTGEQGVIVSILGSGAVILEKVNCA